MENKEEHNLKLSIKEVKSEKDIVCGGNCSVGVGFATGAEC